MKRRSVLAALFAPLVPVAGVVIHNIAIYNTSQLQQAINVAFATGVCVIRLTSCCVKYDGPVYVPRGISIIGSNTHSR